MIKNTKYMMLMCSFAFAPPTLNFLEYQQAVNKALETPATCYNEYDVMTRRTRSATNVCNVINKIIFAGNDVNDIADLCDKMNKDLLEYKQDIELIEKTEVMELIDKFFTSEEVKEFFNQTLELINGCDVRINRLANKGYLLDDEDIEAFDQFKEYFNIAETIYKQHEITPREINDNVYTNMLDIVNEIKELCAQDNPDILKDKVTQLDILAETDLLGGYFSGNINIGKKLRRLFLRSKSEDDLRAMIKKFCYAERICDTLKNDKQDTVYVLASEIMEKVETLSLDKLDDKYQELCNNVNLAIVPKSENKHRQLLQDARDEHEKFLKNFNIESEIINHFQKMEYEWHNEKLYNRVHHHLLFKGASNFLKPKENVDKIYSELNSDALGELGVSKELITIVVNWQNKRKKIEDFDNFLVKIKEIPSMCDQISTCIRWSEEDVPLEEQ